MEHISWEFGNNKSQAEASGFEDRSHIYRIGGFIDGTSKDRKSGLGGNKLNQV